MNLENITNLVNRTGIDATTAEVKQWMKQAKIKARGKTDSEIAQEIIEYVASLYE